MAVKKWTFELDIKNKTRIPKMTLVKGDTNSNVFEITLVPDVDLTDTLVTLTFLKEDGNVVVGQADITDPKNGVISYTIKGNEISYPGIVIATVEVYNSDKTSRFTSTQFKFNVIDQLNDGEGIESETEYNILTDLINQLQPIFISEDERKSNEIQRIDNENNRLLNEQERINKEEQRELNENERISNEEQRINNENNRILAENKRKIDEDIRKSNEDERINNENKRLSNESLRQDSENIRQDNENIRQSNESFRQTKEQERTEKEQERIANEQERINNEQERIENENTRRQNESVRELNEFKRIDNENARKNEELIRQSNENIRQNNENIRQDNEQNRQLIMNDFINKFQRFYELPSNIDIEYNEDNNPIKITETYSFGEETLELTYLNGLLYTAKETMITPELVQKEYRHRYKWTQIEDEGELILRLEKVESVEVS